MCSCNRAILCMKELSNVRDDLPAELTRVDRQLMSPVSWAVSLMTALIQGSWRR